MLITEVFPWSAEAKILNYLTDEWHKDPEKWHSMDEIHKGAGCHERSVQRLIYKLAKIHLVQIYRYRVNYGNRQTNITNFTRVRFRLKINDLSMALLRFKTELLKC